jgi:hypothetical protein
VKVADTRTVIAAAASTTSIVSFTGAAVDFVAAAVAAITVDIAVAVAVANTKNHLTYRDEEDGQEIGHHQLPAIEGEWGGGEWGDVMKKAYNVLC